MTAMYAGNILRVNLSEAKISKEPTSTYSGDFLGGRGVNAKILYDEVPPEIEPLDPDSRLIFGVGPLCGTPIPASRVEVTFKSPETGFMGSSNFGGYFGPELKYAGYDHLVVSGKADKPVYLWIYNGQVEIRDASHLWGKDTYETQDILRSECELEARVICIGQAGENLVRFATVQTDLGHAGARTGPGTVMGSKNLKAIVVRGTKGVDLADPERYLSLVSELQQELKNHPGIKLFKNGTTTLMAAMDPPPDITPEEAEAARGEGHPLVSKHKPKRAGCLGCPAQCMDQYQVKGIGGTAISCEYYGEAYSTVKNDDLDLGLECSLLTQRYGIDVDSSMVILRWLMELFEDGIITAEDTDGIAMEWGSREAILGMLRKIASREGFGDILADGILQAAERIGRGSVEYAKQVKGLPTMYLGYLFPAGKSISLNLAVGTRADLMKSGSMQFDSTLEQLPILYDEKTASELETYIRRLTRQITGMEGGVPGTYEGKPETVSFGEDATTICDCLSVCKWIGIGWYAIWPLAEESRKAALFSAGTGIETSVDTLFNYAAKVRTLEQAYNARLGMTRDMDTVPRRYLDRLAEDAPLESGATEPNAFEEMKSKYYALKGWDAATGIPTREALEKVGLGDVAADLEKRGKLPKGPPQAA